MVFGDLGDGLLEVESKEFVYLIFLEELIFRIVNVYDIVFKCSYSFG